MSNSFAFDNYDLSGPNYGLTVLKGPWVHLPDPVLDLQETGGQTGAVLQSAIFKPRYFTLTCLVEATTRLNLYTQLDNLAVLLNPRNGTKFMMIDRDMVGGARSRGYFAVLNGPINPEPKGRLACGLNLNFVVPAGVAYSAEEVSRTGIAIDESPETITQPATGTVGGNIAAHPTWVIVNTHASGINTVTLECSTIGDECTWNGSLAQNDQLRIESAINRMYVSKSTNGGSTWNNAMADLDLDTTPYVRLQAGVANTVIVTGLAAGTLDVTYREEFI